MARGARPITPITRAWEYLSVPFEAEAGSVEAQAGAHARGGWELFLVAPPRYGSLAMVMHFRRPAPNPPESPRNHR